MEQNFPYMGHEITFVVLLDQKRHDKKEFEKVLQESLNYKLIKKL